MKKNIIILFLSLSICISFAQTDANEDSQSVRSEFAAISQKVDSLKKELSTCRASYDSDPQKYGSLIVSLEAELLDASQLYTQLEKKVSSLPAGDVSQKVENNDNSFSGSDISKSPFFQANFQKKDLDVIKNSSAVYSSLSETMNKIQGMYDSLKLMKEKYGSSTSQKEVDDILIASEQLKKSIRNIDNEFNDSWSLLYNAKIDNYLVMLDKLGNISRSQLENLDLLSRQAQSSVNPDETLAPSIADLKAQNRLILSYEEIFAEKLGYKNALDKIHIQMKENESSEATLFPDIEFPYRSTSVYGNISLNNSYSYSTVQEIPEVKVPSTGVYYSVQLYISQTPVKQLSTFKGAEPLMQMKSGGYYRYLAGGYRTYAEANKNLSAMYKAGFRSPRIVAWLNGSLTTYDKAKAAESSSALGGYIIEVKSSNASTASVIKEIISVHAEGKTWTSASEGEKTIYRIMTFDSKEEAGVIAQIIKTKDSSVDANVIENSED